MGDNQSGVVTLKVRVTPEFREKIVDTAKQNNRSMNAEIVHRLEQSFNNNYLTSNQIPTDGSIVATGKIEEGFGTPVVGIASTPIEAVKDDLLVLAIREMSASELFDLINSSFGSVSLTIEEANKTKEMNKKAP